MNVFDQIDKIFATQDPSRPEWVDEILHELKEIKDEIKKQQAAPAYSSRYTSYNDDYFTFIKELRRKMRADIANNIYPDIMYEGKRYGIDFNGLLYDKEISTIIKTEEAKKIYRYLYAHKNKAV